MDGLCRAVRLAVLLSGSSRQYWLSLQSSFITDEIWFTVDRAHRIYLRFKEITVYPNSFAGLLAREKSCHDRPMGIETCRDIRGSYPDLTWWTVCFPGTVFQEDLSKRWSFE